MGGNDRWDRVKRLFGETAYQHLMGKTVAVLGLGSGGGYVALSLAMCGVGGFILVDKDVLEESNIPRHVADDRYLGRAKVEAVKDLILHRNSLAKVEATQADARQVLKQLKNANLVLVCLDTEPVKQALNTELRRMGKTAIYAGVYEQGIGGDVCIVYPKKGPCYACLASVLREATVKDTPQNLDYGMITEEGVLKGEPGLGIHVSRVALLQADWAIRELLRGTKSSLAPFSWNVAIVANQKMEAGEIDGKPVILRPGQTLWSKVPRDPNCLVCGLKKSQKKVPLSELLGK